MKEEEVVRSFPINKSPKAKSFYWIIVMKQSNKRISGNTKIKTEIIFKTLWKRSLFWWMVFTKTLILTSPYA